MHISQSIEDLFPIGYTPYEHQPEVLNQIKDAINEGHKFIIVQAPTGAGKSFITKTLANATRDVDPVFERLVRFYDAYDQKNLELVLATHPHGAFVLTTTKQLQNQYVSLFNDGVPLKGQGNYQCAVDDEFTVDLAPCTVASKQKKICWNENKCPYYNARNNALIAKFSVLNYSKFFTIPDALKRKDIIICDEAAELENEFVGSFSCKIVYKKLVALKIDHPKLIHEDRDNAYAWLGELLVKVEEELGKNTKSRYLDVSKWDTARQVVLSQMRESIENILGAWASVHYVIERDGDRAEFIPFKIAPLTHHLFDSADTYVLMSATIVNPKNYAKTLGITDFKYIEAPSVFDPKKSPIHVSSKYPLSYNKMAEYLPKVIDQVVQITNAHAGEKGIIHTHSFEITQAVQRKLRGKRFLYREEGSTNEDILKEHIIRKDDTVLISPSLTMGVDLKGDLGKWQIIIKLPYPSLGAKRVKMLFDEDKEWYAAQMLKVLVQAAGRCTRSKEDEAVTYILDGNVVRILKENTDILPKHFMDRIM
jgi:ATP-dependent DNA helicase DinG